MTTDNIKTIAVRAICENGIEVLPATAENIFSMMPKLPDIDERIEDIALKYCKDYPDIKTVDSYERLWAIECAIGGCRDANRDLHSVIAKLQIKYGIGIEEIFELSDLARKENDQLKKGMK